MFATLLLSLAPCQAPSKEPLPGRAMIDAYFARQVKQIADNCLNDLTTKEDWEKRRPELRRQFLEMMGLWPLPERTDLKATVTGTVDGEGYTVEKLHFQSKPGLYVTANVYTPNPKPPGKLPAILYVCGHGNTVENGISYGSKVSYQYHPAWFAKHGYVCIILDTLQLGEIKGEHHGTYRLNQWWWQSRGYTPGGVELWNAMRALDYLETRPDVDAKKIGVTGRSGGGATSWWVAAADDRPAAIAPIAGIADLESHVCKGQTDRLKDGVIAGHCDCMYMVNTYRWDFAMVAALAAPRPLLLGNSDADDIFPVPGYRSIAAKVGKVYDLYGKRDYFDLLETKGPHKDTPELRIGINRFMNKWLKGDTTTKVEDDLPPKLPATALKVLKETPKDAINEKIAETFVPKASSFDIPADLKEPAVWWFQNKVILTDRLMKQCFAGWPKQANPIEPKLIDRSVIKGVRVEIWELESESGIPIRFVLCRSDQAEPKKLQMSVMSGSGWKLLGSFFGQEWMKRQDSTMPAIPEAEQIQSEFFKSVESNLSSYCFVIPRGVGPTKWAESGTTEDTQIRRRFALVGQTLDGQHVWDTRRAIQALSMLDGWKELELTIEGGERNVMISSLASLFEPHVKRVKIVLSESKQWEPAVILNIEKVVDHPGWLVLLGGKPVTISGRNERRRAEWKPFLEKAKLLGLPNLEFTP